MNSDFQQARSLPEWITFIVATLILLGVVGLTLNEWRTQQDSPPILNVNISSSIRTELGQYYVPFSVINSGGTTVEAVQVIAELRVNGSLLESGEQQIDFLASDERQEGAFIFTRNPQQAELTIRVASYKAP
ncbi:MAG: TIGR02588 family protein [Desertifilum sp. SIO1I2]|nr:TIGR02588 family protein [Desertifilum sp. SIO1I2]